MLFCTARSSSNTRTRMAKMITGTEDAMQGHVTWQYVDSSPPHPTLFPATRFASQKGSTYEIESGDESPNRRIPKVLRVHFRYRLAWCELEAAALSEE